MYAPSVSLFCRALLHTPHQHRSDLRNFWLAAKTALRASLRLPLTTSLASERSDTTWFLSSSVRLGCFLFGMTNTGSRLAKGQTRWKSFPRSCKSFCAGAKKSCLARIGRQRQNNNGTLLICIDFFYISKRNVTVVAKVPNARTGWRHEICCKTLPARGSNNLKSEALPTPDTETNKLRHQNMEDKGTGACPLILARSDLSSIKLFRCSRLRRF